MPECSYRRKATGSTPSPEGRLLLSGQFLLWLNIRPLWQLSSKELLCPIGILNSWCPTPGDRCQPPSPTSGNLVASLVVERPFRGHYCRDFKTPTSASLGRMDFKQEPCGQSTQMPRGTRKGRMGHPLVWWTRRGSPAPITGQWILTARKTEKTNGRLRPPPEVKQFLCRNNWGPV